MADFSFVLRLSPEMQTPCDLPLSGNLMDERDAMLLWEACDSGALIEANTSRGPAFVKVVQHTYEGRYPGQHHQFTVRVIGHPRQHVVVPEERPVGRHARPQPDWASVP